VNKYELVYDLKEHLDTYSQTYDDYIMSYGEADMIYHYIEEQDKEIERLNNIINELEEYIKPFLYMLNGITDRDIYEECQLDDFTMIMEKLQELKGSESNE